MIAHSLKYGVRTAALSFNKRCFTQSSFCFQRIIEVVPPLGESITEGSIAQWVKGEGTKVEVDDVIVVVETDKVTVDVKSTRAGILIKQLATDTVIVGKPLYEMEVSESSQNLVVTKLAEVAKPASATIAESAKPSHGPVRIPLIKFIGKRSSIKAPHTPHEIKPVTLSSPVVTKKPLKPQTGVDFFTLTDGAWHGRPKLSLKEIEAIESGGVM